MIINKNDKIELQITDAAADGAGIGRVDGIAVFVPSAAVGDLCKVLIVKVEKSFLRGKLIEVKSPSPDRIEPICSAAELCGGCTFAHITYEAELRIKEERVRACISRIGGLSAKILPIVPAPATTSYRNKVIFPVGMREGRPAAGFYAPRSHRLINAEQCNVHDPRDRAIVTAILNFMREREIPPYDEESGSGVLRSIFIRRLRSGEVAATLVSNADKIKDAAALCRRICDADSAVCSVMLNINKKITNVILGEKCECLYGKSYLEDTLCGLRFRISPLSFYQINSAQCERLYAKVAEYAALKGDEAVCDLYCGIGTIGLSLAKSAKRIIGVEVVPQAVEDARENARINGIENAEFFCGGAEDFAEIFPCTPELCVVDPPRKGCDEKLVDTLARLAPKKLIYVSCDPATLARDLKRLSEKNFIVNEIAPFDMFPRTSHVECVCLLTAI